MQPRFPQVQGMPSSSRIICPSSPPMPWAPFQMAPLIITPEPIPVPRVLTRRKNSAKSNTYVCGDLTVDAARHRVTRGDGEIVLTAKEYALLEYLIRNKGIVLSREQIETNLWSGDYIVGSNVVDVYIRMLRKKVDANYEDKLIQTVRGYGYVLKEPET